MAIFEQTIDEVARLIQQAGNVAVCWLYGSRAKGTFTSASDIDLAVAFSDERNAKGLMAESPVATLEFSLSQVLSLPVSVVDINRAPVPLAYSVISDGVVIFSRDALRLRAEQHRVWSLWESYKYEFEAHRQ
ncbi:type VII toxin-antitoxin system MntA family adenylyltransferase antitoxin [Saccharophagus degradans]|uniref:Nucleotidyltransferase domain-containing protein n=1 Tax=Saccharophagus degradans TaxID=86304 RepID=A0AAW7X374_9GAMM|nr:nucleotidyltransferase domain-containing protein [Saccharophagus degradans]MDO6421066.1 nucleotidyltransferase domain-containing protein [Saccharophagus degradans]MDO6606023.1 nucleotidyltransferase domain-containing protein [Saccharophagus degradans]